MTIRSPGSSLPATKPRQAAEQAEPDQRQAGRLRRGRCRFAEEEVVHHDDVVVRIAELAVGHYRIEPRGDPDPADASANVGDSTQEAQSLVASDQNVARIDQRIARIEELHPGQV